MFLKYVVSTCGTWPEIGIYKKDLRKKERKHVLDKKRKIQEIKKENTLSTKKKIKKRISHYRPRINASFRILLFFFYKFLPLVGIDSRTILNDFFQKIGYKTCHE